MNEWHKALAEAQADWAQHYPGEQEPLGWRTGYGVGRLGLPTTMWLEKQYETGWRGYEAGLRAADLTPKVVLAFRDQLTAALAELGADEQTDAPPASDHADRLLYLVRLLRLDDLQRKIDEGEVDDAGDFEEEDGGIATVWSEMGLAEWLDSVPPDDQTRERGFVTMKLLDKGRQVLAFLFGEGGKAAIGETGDGHEGEPDVHSVLLVPRRGMDAQVEDGYAAAQSRLPMPWLRRHRLR